MTEPTPRTAGPPEGPLRLDRAGPRTAIAFDLRADAGQRGSLAAELGIRAIRKLRFAGTLQPIGRADWALSARLGATVVQDCGVTLAPVVTRIEEAVIRRYLADLPPPEPGESEMPADDTAEPLPRSLDLWAVVAEALSLALPPWPRAEGASFDPAAAGLDGAGDPDDHPFAGLAALRPRDGGAPPD